MSTLQPRAKYSSEATAGKKFIISLEAQPIISSSPKSPRVEKSPRLKLKERSDSPHMIVSLEAQPVLRSPVSPRSPRLVGTSPQLIAAAQRSPALTKGMKEICITQKHIHKPTQETKLIQKQSPYGSPIVTRSPLTVQKNNLSGPYDRTRAITLPAKELMTSQNNIRPTNTNVSPEHKRENRSKSLPNNAKKQLSPEDMKRELQRMYGGSGSSVNVPHHEGHSEFCSCKVKGNFYE